MTLQQDHTQELLLLNCHKLMLLALPVTHGDAFHSTKLSLLQLDKLFGLDFGITKETLDKLFLDNLDLLETLTITPLEDLHQVLDPLSQLVLTILNLINSLWVLPLVPANNALILLIAVNVPETPTVFGA